MNKFIKEIGRFFKEGLGLAGTSALIGGSLLSILSNWNEYPYYSLFGIISIFFAYTLARLYLDKREILEAINGRTN